MPVWYTRQRNKQYIILFKKINQHWIIEREGVYASQHDIFFTKLESKRLEIEHWKAKCVVTVIISVARIFFSSLNKRERKSRKSLKLCFESNFQTMATNLISVFVTDSLLSLTLSWADDFFPAKVFLSLMLDYNNDTAKGFDYEFRTHTHTHFLSFSLFLIYCWEELLKQTDNGRGRENSHTRSDQQ